MSTSAEGLDIRAATPADLPAVLGVLQASLGWVPDAQYRDFYRWKHLQNAFGSSPAWVAIVDGRIAALRTWLRWEFEHGERRYRAVRAVDTATDPAFRGRGIFRALTMHGIDRLRDEGVDFVFNTPNDNSRPGYLKMGWREVGKLPTAVRFASPAAFLRTATSGVPADKWSVAARTGRPALEALADDTAIDELLRLRAASSDGVRTALTIEVLRWRYGFEPLAYRGLWTDDGLVIFRLRRRGRATECVICLVLARDKPGRRRLLAALSAGGEADHLLQISTPQLREGFVPLPGQAPLLTWREVTEPTMPPLDAWTLTMGDVELF